MVEPVLINVPEYFKLEELTATSVKLKNCPDTWEKVVNLLKLARFLDTIRIEFGKPIRVNSGFRTEAVNSAVGGVASSAHVKGLAADIVAWSGKESDNRELMAILDKACESGRLDQLISYHKKAGVKSETIRFFHVGLSDKLNRRQRLYK